MMHVDTVYDAIWHENYLQKWVFAYRAWFMDKFVQGHSRLRCHIDKLQLSGYNSLYISFEGFVLVGLRPGTPSWLKFHPEDEGDGKVIAESDSGNFNKDLDELS